MSFRKTFLVALTTLFVIPLVIFMGQSIQLGGTLSAWAGLLMGSIYGACALGVCWLLLGYWERRLLGAGEEPEGNRTLGMPTSDDILEPESRWLTDLPIERELIDALDPSDPSDDDWAQQQQGTLNGEVHTLEEARVLLRACIAKAEKLPSLVGGSDRFRALTLDNYAIDMRRLFDALRHESSSAVIVLYSRDERRLLFATEAVQRLFGWAPERFAERFPGLIIGARASWEEAIASLEPQQEISLRLILQTKSRDHAPAESTWCLISSGSFQGIAIGVLCR